MLQTASKPPSLLTPLLCMLLGTGCLIDIDIADHRRSELENTQDSGEETDTAPAIDTDEDTDTPPVDCSAVVAPSPVGDTLSIRNSGPVTCVVITHPEPAVECSAPEGNELVQLIPQTAFRSIALGRETFCGVRATDRRIECVGAATGIVDSVPEGIFSSIALTRDGEGDTACALNISGEVTCWGNNDYGIVSTAPTEGMCSVAMAQHHGCGIRDNGTLECWGSGAEGVAGASVPAGTYRDVTVGRDFACAVSSTGDLSCWGDRAAWTDEEAVPDVDARWVAAANHSGCALTDANTLSCWGPQPDDLPVDEEFQQITAGNHKVCGLRADESWGCWGLPPAGPPP